VAITAAPRHGEHTRDVLTADLGLSEADVDGLLADGVAAVPKERQPEPDPAP
jgi:hypothetical protein